MNLLFFTFSLNFRIQNPPKKTKPLPSLCLPPAWPGPPSPAAWAPRSPPSTPTPRLSSSSGTSARPLSRASARSTRGRPLDTFANTLCTPFPRLWTFTPARPPRAAGRRPYRPTLWTWVTSQAPWGRSSVEMRPRRWLWRTFRHFYLSSCWAALDRLWSAVWICNQTPAHLALCLQPPAKKTETVFASCWNWWF